MKKITIMFLFATVFVSCENEDSGRRQVTLTPDYEDCQQWLLEITKDYEAVIARTTNLVETPLLSDEFILKL